MARRARTAASLADGRAHCSDLRVVAVHAAAEGAHGATMLASTLVLPAALITVTVVLSTFGAAAVPLTIVGAAAVVAVFVLPLVLVAVVIVVALGDTLTVIAGRSILPRRRTRPCHHTPSRQREAEDQRKYPRA